MEKKIGLYIGEYPVGEYEITEYLSALEDTKIGFEESNAIHEIKIITK